MQRRMYTGLVVVGVVAVGSGCGGDKLAEKLVEDRIEAEGGGDVDIDFDGGDLSIKTEDGEFSIKTDSDGNVSVQGSGQDGDGNFTIDSENGETVFEGEDGTAVFSQNGDLPEDFPGEIPVPDHVTIVFAQSATSGEGTGYAIAGTTARSIGDVSAEMQSSLEANGFSQEQLTTTPDGSIMVYRSASYVVTAIIGESSETTSLTLNVAPAT